MKRKILVCALGLSACLSFAGTDFVAERQRAAQFAQTVKHWRQQAEEYKKQMDIAKEELKAFTGIRDIEHVLDELQDLKRSFKSLKDQFSNINAVIDQGFDGLDPKTKNILEKNGIGRSCQNENDVKLRKLCEGQIVFRIGNTTEQERMMKDVSKTVEKLARLAQGAKRANDPKEALDFSNQINVLVGMLKAQEIQHNLRKENEERLEKLIRRKLVEIDVEKLGATRK